MIEFLLARIAEDEALARDEQRLNDIPSDCWGPARVLAECEARTTVVEICQVLMQDSSDSAWWSIDKADAILAALAAPYASHPDFRPERTTE